jgi:hypothetical protein
MISIINPGLFTFSNEVKGEEDPKEYVTHVKVADDINSVAIKNIYPLTRIISYKYTEDIFKGKHNIISQLRPANSNPSKSVRVVFIRTKDNPAAPDDHILLLAYPFTGTIDTIPESDEYRIYKGLLVTTASNHIYNDKKYRKILYLIMSFNTKILEANESGVDLSLRSYTTMPNENGDYEENILDINITANGITEKLSTKYDYEQFPSKKKTNSSEPELLYVLYKSPAEESDSKRFTSSPVVSTPISEPPQNVLPRTNYSPRKPNKENRFSRGYHPDGEYEYSVSKPTGNKGKKSKSKRKQHGY